MSRIAYSVCRASERGQVAAAERELADRRRDLFRTHDGGDERADRRQLGILALGRRHILLVDDVDRIAAS